MDQKNLRNELVPVSAESEGLLDNSRLSSGTVSCENEASQENASLNIAHRDSSYNTGHAELSRQVPESGLHSEISNPSLTLCQQVSFPENSSGGSSSRASFSNNDGEEQNVAECYSDKRKNIERDLGECSESQNSSNLNEGNEINARISSVQRDGTFDHTSVCEARTSEWFQRNTRRRISHVDGANASAPDIRSQYNNINHNPLSPQSSSALVLPNQPMYVRFLGSNLEPYRQHHVRSVPSRFRQSGISRMEIGSSSGSRADVVDRAAAELHLLCVPINISGQVFVLPIAIRNMIQDQTTSASASGNPVLFGNSLLTSQVVIEFGVYSLEGANWLAYLNQHQISSAVSRVQQLISSGALGIPMIADIFAAAAREGRNWMSAIQDIMHLIRQGDNVLREEVLRAGSAFLGINLQDSYRYMRMDVDNMSYEELLALENRIGSVNTGLSDDKILHCLQQCKYVSTVSETSAAEVEPCCICQEEFTEGEELGRLDCGHDFHYACIKQWLTIKNLCPICKTTALGEPNGPVHNHFQRGGTRMERKRRN
ncbi:probable E3 ubiquitin-protein ligase HIP1 isoform X1 [Zingiber officinale]|uniref:probable E3 ubiquitin-protein ligase HIP1 isoform X1 n=1 Tax=Zingiber officinale TaxID=94328 RepID=UPI001C4BC65D|nr:probable E3 ubiquitin-protein ligase HIP1 isoform X1 [Zingiber officinale]